MKLNLKIVNILTLQVRPKKKIKILLHSFQFLYFLYQKKKASQYIHFAFKYLKSRKERAKHATALVYLVTGHGPFLVIITEYIKEATVTTKGLYTGVDKNWDFLGQILQTSVNKI